MATRTVAVDWGPARVPIEVPAGSHVVECADPPLLPDPAGAVRTALARPIGLPPLAEWVRPGSQVTIAFDDPLRAAAPRQLMLPIVLEELARAGVRGDDIRLVSANANHRKFTPAELRAYLSPAIYDAFAGDPAAPRVLNHDAEDPAGLIALGQSEFGDWVEVNRCLADSDHVIYLGTAGASNWGGITGTGVVIGLGSGRSIRAHHRHEVVDHPESTHGDARTSLFQRRKQAVMARIEAATGRPVFYLDAILGPGAGLAGVVAGRSPEITEVEWDLVERFFQVETPPADILVIGLPERLSYSDSHNPLTLMACLLTPVRMGIGRPLLRPGGVIIGLARCRGVLDPNRFPSWQAALDLWDRCPDAAALAAYTDDLLNRPDLVHAYRHAYAFHPLHGVWLFNECQYVFDLAGRIIVAGPDLNPGALRRVGLTPAASFDAAWRQALAIAGADARVVVLPDYWSRYRLQFRVRQSVGLGG